MTNRNNFLGISSFIWWVGIVENRVDPLGFGRCQVRIFGWHTQNQSQLPVTDLPWAQPMYPINNSKSFSAPTKLLAFNLSSPFIKNNFACSNDFKSCIF